MVTEQIYTLVNGAAEQTMGKQALEVVDTNSFVSLGNVILSQKEMTENFCNALILRIARTIVSFRMYDSRLKPIIFDDIRWGAIVQKLKVEMPEAVEDEAYDLVDGESVDMYVIRKPKVNQKFFVNRTPYSFFITIQRWQLRRAFMNESAFGAFVSAIFGEVRNKLEVSFETLGYMTIANFMANTKPAQQVKLVTEYNAATGNSITPANALHDNAFLRYAIATMNKIAFRMETMSVLYNQEGFTRHTPISMQRFLINVEFSEAMRTVVQYEAFHEQYVTKAASIEVPHWQNPEQPLSIEVTDSTGATVNMDRIVGFIHDRDALGVYRKEDEVLTTPVNARGRYTNTFWHEEQMWFNDLSENGVVFLLA